MNDAEKTPEYFAWIAELKNRYRTTQIKAAISVNAALLEFYWSLGKDICERYPGKRRNAHFFTELSADLKIAMPEAKGLSERNLKYMLAFFSLYHNLQTLNNRCNAPVRYRQQVVADNAPSDHKRNQFADGNSSALPLHSQLESDANNPQLAVTHLLMKVPWGHHIVIINKCGTDIDKALFYVRKTVENNWSRNALSLEIAGDLYSRQGKAVTNFALTMPLPDSDLAQQLTKDPYIFEVQGLAEKYHETELTEAMCNNIVRLLNAMGKGFAFVGREFVVEMAGEEYRMDLLFYSIPLHRYVVIEVKTDGFRPEYLGQLQGYVAACDLILNTPQEKPAIGLLVCRGKNAPLANYLIGKIDMPIGISDYELLRKVPDDFKSQLPTIEEIETELALLEKKGQ